MPLKHEDWIATTHWIWHGVHKIGQLGNNFRCDVRVKTVRQHIWQAQKCTHKVRNAFFILQIKTTFLLNKNNAFDRASSNAREFSDEQEQCFWSCLVHVFPMPQQSHRKIHYIPAHGRTELPVHDKYHEHKSDENLKMTFEQHHE